RGRRNFREPRSRHRAPAPRSATQVAARVKRLRTLDMQPTRRGAPPRTTTVAIVMLALMIAGATIVPMLAQRDPLAIGDVLALRLVPPLGRDSAGAWHLLGTDRFGRDLFVRM